MIKCDGCGRQRATGDRYENDTYEPVRSVALVPQSPLGVELCDDCRKLFWLDAVRFARSWKPKQETSNDPHPEV